MCMGMVQEEMEEREEGERVVGGMEKEEGEREVMVRVGEEEAYSRVAVRSTWPQLWQLPQPLRLLSHRPAATTKSGIFVLPIVHRLVHKHINAYHFQRKVKTFHCGSKLSQCALKCTSSPQVALTVASARALAEANANSSP